MNLGLSYVSDLPLLANVISPDEKSSGFPLMEEDRAQIQLHTLKAIHDLPPSYTPFQTSLPINGRMHELHTCCIYPLPLCILSA